MKDKIEDIMEGDGWIAGYSINWGVKYFSFRKEGFEIDWKDIHNVYPEDEEDGKHYQSWKSVSDINRNTIGDGK